MRLFFFVVCIGLALLFFGLRLKKPVIVDGGADYNMAPFWITGVVVSLVGAVLLCFAVVPPRSVGVEVTFGKTSGMLTSGLHARAPWTNVIDYPATIQTTRLFGNGGGDVDGPAVTVRLGNQTTANVNVTAQWTVNTNDHAAVQALYARWRSFDHIEPNFVRPQLQHAMLAPFEHYDPLKVLQANAELVVPTADLEKAARAELVSALGNGITITTLTINLVAYDATTQDKLNAYAQAVADTRIANQRESTAEAQRRANDALAGSGASKDPGVLYQNCIDMTERLVKEGKGLPAAWSCGSQVQPVVPVR